MSTNGKIRVLGKGITAQAIKENFDEVILYDESNFSSYDLKSDDITIVSPGIPPYNNMVKNSKNLISDYDLVYENMPFSIWISGTNGKTTTTEMIQSLFEEKGSVYGGNIGIPISKLDKKAPIWILETSSFTFHYTKTAKPNLYILLPISEDHISWHGNYEEYRKAKLKPLDMMNEGEIAIIPEEFKDYSSSAMKITYKNSDDLCKKFDIDKNKINLKEPFLLDALLALASKKIVYDEIDYKKINLYKIASHKVEEFKDKFDRLWIDDSKATNIDATINALAPYLEKEIFLILGGDDKGANLKPLFEYIKDLNLKIYSIGTNSKKIKNFADKFGIENFECETLLNAVEKIALNHHKNSISILSPAAASLDQFISYKDRGNKFKDFVCRLS